MIKCASVCVRERGRERERGGRESESGREKFCLLSFLFFVHVQLLPLDYLRKDIESSSCNYRLGLLIINNNNILVASR